MRVTAFIWPWVVSSWASLALKVIRLWPSLKRRMLHQVASIFYLWGCSTVEELRDVLCIPWEEARTLPQGCAVIFQLLHPFPYITSFPQSTTTSLAAKTVKCLSTMPETRVWSLGWEDPLEKEMAIHSKTTAWKIPWTEEPGGLQPTWSQRVGHDWATSSHFTSMKKWEMMLPGTSLKTDRFSEERYDRKDDQDASVC